MKKTIQLANLSMAEIVLLFSLTDNISCSLFMQKTNSKVCKVLSLRLSYISTLLYGHLTILKANNVWWGWVDGLG